MQGYIAFAVDLQFTAAHEAPHDDGRDAPARQPDWCHVSEVLSEVLALAHAASAFHAHAEHSAALSMNATASLPHVSHGSLPDSEQAAHGISTGPHGQLPVECVQLGSRTCTHVRPAQ
jgi:hypothetical protein